jgi:ribosomal protein S18 acetylase RimI-like enzyme
MIIRQANQKDATDIIRLLIQLGYSSLSVEQVSAKIARYDRDGYKLLVCEIDNNAIGFISLHWYDIFHSVGFMGRITAFCVDEQFRSRGIGKQLLTHAEKIFMEAGCTKLEVSSNARRTQTHDFYLRAAYIEDSRRFVKYIP